MMGERKRGEKCKGRERGKKGGGWAKVLRGETSKGGTKKR